jgi:hypothetical protein
MTSPLAVLGRRCGGLLATNTMIERSFSSFGNIITKKRTRLRNSVASQLLYIRINNHFNCQKLALVTKKRLLANLRSKLSCVLLADPLTSVFKLVERELESVRVRTSSPREQDNAVLDEVFEDVSRPTLFGDSYTQSYENNECSDDDDDSPLLDADTVAGLDAEDNFLQPRNMRNYLAQLREHGTCFIFFQYFSRFLDFAVLESFTFNFYSVPFSYKSLGADLSKWPLTKFTPARLRYHGPFTKLIST